MKSLTALASAFIAVALVGCSKQEGATNQILFPSKSYADTLLLIGRDSLVHVVGTQTGEGVPLANNTVAVDCYRDTMQCFVSKLGQIGDNQVAWLITSSRFSVTEWTPLSVVAADLDTCSKTTISIGRPSGAVLWVTEPINQTELACKDSETRILKWTIEDSPGWKKIKGH